MNADDQGPASGSNSETRFVASLTAPLPHKWFAKESITLLAPDGQANVIVSSEPLDEDIDLKAYVDVQGDLLHREFPGYREFQFDELDVFGGRSGYLRRFAWTPPDGAPVTQIQVYYVERGRGYTATATTPVSQFGHYEDQLRLILAGLTIDK